MSENGPPSISLTRTIYDPAKKDFITSTPDAKVLPHIKEWINQHNPVIYWYVLRVDNPADASIDQWAVELYTHQALTITEAYIDGIDRRFEVRKRERDTWSEKYVLSISRQVGIPIIGKGTRRIFFKVDIDCKEGLMYKYGISGAFVAQGMDPIQIKEKMFQYSCKVDEFKQIFDKDPYKASHYAEERLSGKYPSNSVHVFTNSFRMIHELSNYCHSGSLDRDELLRRLHLLHTSFEKIPEIASERITPLINDSIRELDVIVDINRFISRFIKLCDSLVELLHMEVMGAEIESGTGYASSSTDQDKNNEISEPGIGNARIICPSYENIIDSSNKSLICRECDKRFCTTCEEWFRKERKPGQKPLCENCFSVEQERMKRDEDERKQKEDEEKVKKQREEQEHLHREEDEKLRNQRGEEKANKKTESSQRVKKVRKAWEPQRRGHEKRNKRNAQYSAAKRERLPMKIFMLVLVLGVLLSGFWMLASNLANTQNITESTESSHQPEVLSPTTFTPTPVTPIPIAQTKGEWQYHRDITIHENSGRTLNNYQVLVELSGTDLMDKMQTDCDDIRFTDADGNSMSYWIEEFNKESRYSRIWVKVHEIPANSKTKIVMWYGNPSAESASNGEAVFEFFDDFSGSSLDENKWTIEVGENGGRVEVSDGLCKLLSPNPSPSYSRIISRKMFDINSIFVVKRTKVTTGVDSRGPMQRQGFMSNRDSTTGKVENVIDHGTEFMNEM